MMALLLWRTQKRATRCVTSAFVTGGKVIWDTQAGFITLCQANNEPTALHHQHTDTPEQLSLFPLLRCVAHSAAKAFPVTSDG